MTPRGVRNNSPLNVRHSAAQQFVGERAPDAEGFCTFVSPIDGIRAGARILLTYYRRDGIRTIRGAITRWSATDQGPYVRFVSAYVGTAADQAFNFLDPVLLYKLVSAIIYFEIGANPYNPTQIKVALAQAIGGTP
ncbi:MAG TPA: hypothetical protein VHQ92_01050 [Pseudolabrys sp.]|jgi:hypothetical protein|nr:hypothetical protein [Pseudolabrys sp.]